MSGLPAATCGHLTALCGQETSVMRREPASRPSFLLRALGEMLLLSVAKERDRRSGVVVVVVMVVGWGCNNDV